MGKWDDGYDFVAPVDNYGTKGRNGFGLADMTGNVWEWCLDYYSDNGAKSTYNGTKSSYRIVRGGSFVDNPGFLRCGDRKWSIPEEPRTYGGFRIVCSFGISR